MCLRNFDQKSRKVFILIRLPHPLTIDPGTGGFILSKCSILAEDIQFLEGKAVMGDFLGTNSLSRTGLFLRVA
jgi:hypothetical protein